MLQENSVRKETLQSVADLPCVSSPTGPASSDLGAFSRAIVVEAPGYTERRALHSVLSFAAHLAALMAIVWFWPIAFPQRPYVFAMSRVMVTLPLSSPVFSPRAALSFGPAASGNAFPPMKLVAPVKRLSLSHAAMAPPEVTLNSRPLKMTEALGAVLGGIVNEAARPVIPALPIDIPRDAQIFRAGGDIRPSRLIERVSFDYPEIAKVAHVFGKVVIAAVIDETGKVTEAHLVSGPGMLASATIYNLYRERFQPTMLDGRPTKCDLILQVSFHLAGWEDQGAPR